MVILESLSGITSEYLKCCLRDIFSILETSSYLRDCQTQGYASEKVQVAVEPVHQLVYAAARVDEIPCLNSIELLHPIATQGINNCLEWKT